MCIPFQVLINLDMNQLRQLRRQSEQSSKWLPDLFIFDYYKKMKCERRRIDSGGERDRQKESFNINIYCTAGLEFHHHRGKAFGIVNFLREQRPNARARRP